MKIIWTNKYSQEKGYVQSVSKAKKCFVNTFDADEARTFKTKKAAQTVIDTLVEYGEGENNTFEVVD